MLTERGVLPMGLEIDGVVHREFVLRPATVDDLLQVEASGLAEKGERHATVGLLARQLVQLGHLTRVTVAQLRQLTVPDYMALRHADVRLDKRVSSFRSERAGDAAADDGPGGEPPDRVE